MKKFGLTVIIAVALTLQAQVEPKPGTIDLPDIVIVDPETGSTTTIGRTVKKVDDQTGTIRTTTTVTEAVSQSEFQREYLQTEKDHIPERIATLQDEIVKLQDRSAEIDSILAVFK